MHIHIVAPYTGAWIEIDDIMKRSIRPVVAPYTGAWIEITTLWAFQTLHHVAPYTGAWIEIQLTKRLVIQEVSHPTRVRGLKSKSSYSYWESRKSHPTRVRGLKL